MSPSLWKSLHTLLKHGVFNSLPSRVLYSNMGRLWDEILTFSLPCGAQPASQEPPDGWKELPTDEGRKMAASSPAASSQAAVGIETRRLYALREISVISQNLCFDCLVERGVGRSQEDRSQPEGLRGWWT